MPSRVGDAVQDGFDLFGVFAVDDGSESSDQSRPIIDHILGGTIASDALCASADTTGIASAASGRPVAWDTLFEQADFRIDVHIVNPMEGLDAFDATLAGAFVAHGGIASADGRAFGWQFCLALQHLDDQVDHCGDLVRFGRATWHVVIHINHRVQGAQPGVNLWDGDLALRHVVAVLRTDVLRVIGRDGVESGMDDFSRRTQVCQSGDTTFTGARAESD